MQPNTLQENSLMKPLVPARSDPSSKMLSPRITLRPRRRRPGSRPPTGAPPSGSCRLPLPTGSTRLRDMPFPRLLPHSSSCFWAPGHWNSPQRSLGPLLNLREASSQLGVLRCTALLACVPPTGGGPGCLSAALCGRVLDGVSSGAVLRECSSA